MSISQLFDKLSILNIKLYHLCDVKAQIANSPELFTKKQMAENAANDIKLCKERAKTKSAIDKWINQAIKNGGCDSVDEVKSYG